MPKIIRNFALFLGMGVFLFLGYSARAQHGHPPESEDPDQKLFGKVLESGSFEFHLRSFFMSTINQDDLTDYATWGTGAGLGYFSPRWKGFGVGFSGFFVFRHFENNITEPDPQTGLFNRYEMLLYDVHHPDNNKDMDRLEEFYLSYQKDQLSIWAGRHHFESPLLNASDNRMRPNLYSGISVDYQPGKFRINGAWFSHVISRGSLEWVSVAESFGTYSTGRNPVYGLQDSYQHHIESKGIGVLGAEYQGESLKLKAWNYLAENVFSMTFLEGTGSFSSDKHQQFLWGAQGFYQSALKEGGNPRIENAYILKSERTYGLGLQLGMAWPHAKWTLNYLGISDRGRFLFPREWGREQFFVSLQRERHEGMGGVNAIMTQYDHTFIHDKLKISLGAAHVKTPDLNNIELNKYGVPTYYHFSGLLDYRFDGFFKGLDFQFLAVYKKEDRDQHIPLEYVLNRVNMMNMNLILDYRF